MKKILLPCLLAALIGTGLTPAHASGNPPTATDDEATAPRPGDAGPAQVDVDVVANDTDPESDQLTLQSADPSSVEGGQVDCNFDTGVCSYTDPGGPAPYDDSFNYEISDGTSSDSGTVTIHVVEGQVGPELIQVPRTVTITTFKHNSARTKLIIKGKVDAAEDIAACTDHVPVGIYRNGRQILAGETKDNEGHFAARVADRAGRYKVVAGDILRSVDSDTDADCNEAHAKRRHNHG